MANKFYQPTRAAFGTDMAAALIDKYTAEGVTILYSSATDVVFTCPALSDNVIRISKIQQAYSSTEYMDQLYCVYGSTWTSGTTITNGIPFCGNTRTGSSIDTTAYIDTADLVLGDTFLLCVFPTNRAQLCLVGTLTNGKYLCLGMQNEVSYFTNCHGNLTDGSLGEVEIPTMGNVFTDDGNYVTMPALFTQSTQLLKNMDGTPATILGLVNAATTSRVATSTLYTTSGNWYAATYNRCATGLMCVIG